jgi:uncharacterized protein YecE (DUF72 family)
LVRYVIGTSGWHYDDWRGRFYPEKLPKNKWLEFYARHFPTVELNNSFYRLPSENAFTNWHATTPDGFIFAVKVSRYVTHIKRLKDAGEAMEKFTDKARILAEKLGPLLYQLPPNLHRDDALLEGFLSGLPGEFRHVIEFRHQSWLDEEVFKILRRLNIGLCIFDMPSLTSPLLATADFAYIRFHGSDSLYSSDYPESVMAEWSERISEMAGGLETVYIYFNNDIEGFAIKNAMTLRNYLEKGRQN